MTVTDATDVLVLDVESRVCREAVAMLPNGDAGRIERSGLLEITAASMLRFSMSDDGLSAIELTGLVDDEDVMLRALDDGLRRLGPSGVLVTHNGVAHDLPLILRRCLARWTFDCDAVAQWLDASRDRHVDTMLRLSGRGVRSTISLTDLCASLGIACAVTPARRGRTEDPQLRKGAVDVVRTAVVYLHLEAMRRRDARWLASAWRDLSVRLLAADLRSPHLDPIARQGLVTAVANGVRAMAEGYRSAPLAAAKSSNATATSSSR